MQTTKRVSEAKRAQIAQQWTDGTPWRQLTVQYRHLRREVLRDICASTGARADELPILRQGQRRPWTPAEIDELADMLRQRVPHKDIAARLNRTVIAVEAKVNELRHESAPSDNRRRAIRRCLRCLRFFDSDGPHNRICDTCKETEEWRGASMLPDVAGARVR